MNRIPLTFQSLADRGSGAYVPYICMGDPDGAFTIELARRLCKAGADVLEFGLPFSDPIADGPVVQEAMARSLAAGFRVTDTFGIISSLRHDHIRQPIVLMSYYNPLLQFGIAKFCDRLASAGGDGILVVDLPIEESEELDSAAEESNIAIIRLVTPTTNRARLNTILSKASGFVYIVSVAGVTGARNALSDSALDLMRQVSARTRLPSVIGFGISRPDHVQQALAAGASGVVEGSALISRYSSLLGKRGKALDIVEQHAKEMKEATDKHM